MELLTCNVPAENLILFKAGTLFFAMYVVISLLTGNVRFRSSRTYRSENPVQYWIMIIMLSAMTGWVAYPPFFCGA
jgi:hypothetical protein